MSGHYLVDLDRTLAMYYSGQGIDTIGAPIAPMVSRVKLWLDSGKDVRIFTARAAGSDAAEQIELIENWCEQHLGVALPVTCKKDYESLEIWDDRAVSVLPNLGVAIDEADTLCSIESDAFVTVEEDKIVVDMVTGDPSDRYSFTAREALVLAARLLRAAGALNV